MNAVTTNLPTTNLLAAGLVCLLAVATGCASRPELAHTVRHPAGAADGVETVSAASISVVGYEDEATDEPVPAPDPEEPDDGLPLADRASDSRQGLAELEAIALSLNPNLRRLGQEVAAAEAKASFADKLPDPTLGANVFGHPIETAAGSQRASLNVMQMIPWLARLDAQSQQAAYEAFAVRQEYEAERLKVLADLRERWYRLYVLGKQIEINEANQQQLDSLIEIANARLANLRATQGDVLLGTLELSRLAEQLLIFEQQLASNKAELNRIAGRDAGHPVEIPRQLEADLPDWSHPMLRDVALERQPAIAAARLRTEATRWGIEVARLKRRPDLSLSAGRFLIDDNRPPSRIVDVGRDAWSIGAQVSVPLWRQKYDAIEQEAAAQHFAAHASVDETVQRYDALLLDLWEQARAASETAQLYQSTILPQARQTLAADQQAYGNNAVEFDRVVGDFRNVLALELAYHRAVGQLAIALARIRQAAGSDL